MRAYTFEPINTTQETSTGTGDVHSFAPPSGASAFLITVETNSCRMTLDGTVPSATNGHLFPIGQAPVLILVGPGSSPQFASYAAASSIVNITWLH